MLYRSIEIYALLYDAYATRLVKIELIEHEKGHDRIEAAPEPKTGGFEDLVTSSREGEDGVSSRCGHLCN
jgi:hypothetical protein